MSAETGVGPIGLGPLEPLPLDPRDKRRKRRRRSKDSEQGTSPKETRRPKRHIGRWIAVFVLLVIAGAAVVPITMWNRYATAFVTSRNAAVRGSITQVGGQISGVVASVEVDAGERVTAGQVLARFDDHQLQASILKAKSRLSEATARSSAAYSRIAAAQSLSQEARVTHEQRSQLAATGAISRDELRAAETKLATAQAMENTAIADHEAADAEVATAEAELTLARAELEACVIRAPADGYVVRRISEPGASVVVGQPVVALWIGKDVWVEAWIDEQQLSQITVGNPVTVTINSFPGREFRGKVESIGVSTDFELPETAVPQSRTERMRTTPVIPIRVRLEKADGLFPGLSAVVAIQRSGAK